MVARSPTYRLVHGDCLDVMRTMDSGSVDAVVTDPPYTAAGGSTNGRSEGNEADSQFFLYWMRDVCAEIGRVVKPTGCGFIFCDWRTVNLIGSAFYGGRSSQRAATWRMGQALVWDRECFGLGSPFRNGFEMIAFARGPEWKSELPKDISTVIRHRWPYGAHKNHGAEKPVALCRTLVKWATPFGGVVLDPFAGSGSTGVACIEEGRDFVGIEREEPHVVTATARLDRAKAPRDGTLDFGERETQAITAHLAWSAGVTKDEAEKAVRDAQAKGAKGVEFGVGEGKA